MGLFSRKHKKQAEETAVMTPTSFAEALLTAKHNANKANNELIEAKSTINKQSQIITELRAKLLKLKDFINKEVQYDAMK